MECNKEEASRAKEIAEKKMGNKDFTEARKFALKAQKLYPDLENISQILVVCDVHCAAEQRLFGNVTDWYKILQIERTANDTTIKKQYRKLALQLHPDKNKFAGAESAFKLIGEAQRVLLDREKRYSLDSNLRSASMYKTAMPSHHQQKVPMNSNPVMQTNIRPNFTNFNPPQQHQSRQPSQQGLNGGSTTFWTACRFCSVRYEYRREVLNRSLRCQNCDSPFIAYEVGMQGTTSKTNSSQQAFGQQNYNINRGASKVDVGSQGNPHTYRASTESNQKKRTTSDVPVKPNGKRRRKRAADSSESSESIGSTDSEDDMLAGDDGFPDVSTNREERPRRSTRQKHQVSYKENASDDDDDLLQPDKNNGEAGKINEEVNVSSEDSLQNINGDIREVRGKEALGSTKIDEASEDSASKSTNPDGFVYPDPEFSDFDKDKKEESFAAGQIWAIYDNTDGMPRFYALIRKVVSPGFKLRITWFEPDPEDKDEMNWLNAELPIACGEYKHGNNDTTEDHLMFSHQISCEKIGRSSYKVYPRKGETWALFKNWDIKWYMNAETHRQYEFEFVEILSDYVEGVGVVVAYLAKLKGFVSLFSVVGDNCRFQIPSAELFRFSHRVPSFKMTGQERPGVPAGSYELDPVSLPMNIVEISVPEDLEVKVSHCPAVGKNMGSSDVLKSMNAEGDASTAEVNLERSNTAEGNKHPVGHNNGSAPLASDAKTRELPDQLFFDVVAGKSIEKFQVGQIWAFYCDEDELPRYYGQIKRVKTSPDFELQVTFLTNCWLPENAIRWDDKDMLISCGRFKVKTGSRPCVYENADSVSHLVQTSDDGKINEFEIFPRKGEIWALYRKWTTKIKRFDLQNSDWDYDIVEVVGENDFWMDVLPLELVTGYVSIFKRKKNETMRIRRTELLRFSHQIPAFKLTEKHGNLGGFWELDLGALPQCHYSSKN